MSRDTGGWIHLKLLAPFVERYKNSDMGPVEEYVKDFQYLFGTKEDAVMAAFVANLIGEKGGRTSVLMAAWTESCQLPSASSQARADGRQVKHEERRYLKLVAVRSCSGQSMDKQPFINMERSTSYSLMSTLTS